MTNTTFVRKLNLPLDTTEEKIKELEEKIYRNNGKVTFAVNGDRKYIEMVYIGEIPFQQILIND